MSSIHDAIPARTLFVSQSWPPSVDSAVYFSSISAALAQAVTMSPTRSDPVVIIVFPGTYADALALVSNVHIFGHTRRDVVVTGAVTWTPGAGVNAPQAAIGEEVDVAQLRFEGSISIDSTVKPETGQGCAFDGRSVDMRGGVTVNSRANREDHFQIWGSTLICTMTFTNTIVNLGGAGTYTVMNFNGACDVNSVGDQLYGTMTLVGSSVFAIQGSQIVGDFNVGAGCALEVAGSVLEAPSILTVASGGTADVRGSSYKSNTQLVGPGMVDRSIWRTAFGPTVVGNNVVPLDPPYADANYGVVIENAGLATIVSKSTGSFVLNDPTGGNSYAITILK